MFGEQLFKVMSDRLISVVIPTYNRAADLRRALKSVLAQSYANWEALVVDNHSTDNTEDIVSGFGDPRIELHKIQNNGIIAASRNLGVKHARGEYVAFLDSDDWWKPAKLAESLRYLEAGSDLVYHPLLIAKTADPWRAWRTGEVRSLKAPVFVDLMSNGSPIANSSVVVRRSALLSIGGLSEDPGLVALEDFDAWLRLSRITEKFKKIPKALGYYWMGGNNLSNPDLTLVSIRQFERLYGEDLRKLPVGLDVWWLLYAKGRACYLLGCYPKSREWLRRIQLLDVSPIVALKILWMRLTLVAFRGVLSRS